VFEWFLTVFGVVTPHQRKISATASKLPDWFAANARDLPWRRTQDPYAVWVSEIMLQQTQVKTVIPFWNRWMRELPTSAAVAKAPATKIHKLWEGLGYYTRVRNLQQAAQVIVAQHGGKFPQHFDDVLALPGIGRYTAGAICSIAFNQPTPILDGNVIRVLARLFGIAGDPKAKPMNTRLWQLAEELVVCAQTQATPELKNPAVFAPDQAGHACSFLNQSLMELGALVCTPRNPQCPICPVKRLCAARRENRVTALPNPGRRVAVTARQFVAFVIGHNGRFLIRQRPVGGVNAHLWEFPNVEVAGAATEAPAVFQAAFGCAAPELAPLGTIKHAITNQRITVTAFRADGGGCFLKNKLFRTRGPRPSGQAHSPNEMGVWRTPAQVRQLPLTAAHRKIWERAQAGKRACKKKVNR
jgi:A/G-specific adenine glycosylase